jgi:CRISPR-associated protein Cmr3
MIKKYLKIRPFDTLFFRTGTPFGGGEVSWTESSLLPNPSVLWGAIYSMMMANGLVCKSKLGKDIDEKIKEAELNKLKLGRVFLYNEYNGVDSLMLPVPLDTYQEKEKEENKGVFQLAEKQDELLLSNYQGNKSYLLETQTKESIEGIKDAFMDTSSFTSNTYLYQNRGSLAISKTSDFLEKSHKVGIKRNNHSHTAEEGMLYRINSTQFKEDIYFVVEIEIAEGLEKDFPTNGMLKLGGEGRGAAFEMYQKVKKIDRISIKAKKAFTKTDNNYFRMYLQSATFFDSGTGIEKLKEAGFDILGACLGKAQFIGGFDILKKRPKSMKKAVPAGSVYFLKYKEKKTIQELKSILKNILNTDNKGFGLFELLPLKIK